MDTSELAYKIRMKLNESERVFGNKAKASITKANGSSDSKQAGGQAINPFSLLGSKRTRDQMEDNKFIFKHKEGYINAVKRPVPFEFFL